jgi:nucleoside 2-deoxyribosyltransferase
MKKIYLAGPQVFLKDASVWFEKAAALCLNYRLEALIPLNENCTTPRQIFYHNLSLIQGCDYVAAHLDPFRGAEPDSGTVWEVGFAQALGIPMYKYFSDERNTRQKALGLFGLPNDHQCAVLPDGMHTENFGLSHNLMLLGFDTTVFKSLEAVLRAINENEKLPSAFEPGFIVTNGKHLSEDIQFCYVNPVGITQWTRDKTKALRFARREDAKAFCRHESDRFICAYAALEAESA